VSPVATLSTDNREVLQSNLMMTGMLHLSEKKRRLSVFTNSERMDLFLAFNNIDASCFTFKASTTSLMLDAEQVPFTISNGDGSEVSIEERESLGALDFCLRAFVVPASGTTCTLSISMFPGNLFSIDAAHSPRYLDPRFPGIHLFKVTEVSLGVKAVHLTAKKYGAPIFPVLVTGSSIYEAGSRKRPTESGPPQLHLFNYVQMHSPGVCSGTREPLEEIRGHAHSWSPAQEHPSFKWPTAERPAVNQGEP